MLTRLRTSGVIAVLVLVALVVGSTTPWRATAATEPNESTFVPVTPARILDTRDPFRVGLDGPIVSPIPQKLQVTGAVPTTEGADHVVPVGATGVALNVTVVRPTAPGYVSIRPGDATGTPATSSLNFEAGEVLPNAVIVELPTSGPYAGMIDITYDARGVAGPYTDLLIDVVGFTTDAGLQALAAALAERVDIADVYTKSEIDNALDTKANTDDVYTKTEIDNALDTKANTDDVYTKTEIDARPFNGVVGGGFVGANGTLTREFGDVIVARNGTGAYSIVVGGVDGCVAGFGGITAQVTPLNAGGNPSAIFVSAGFQSTFCPEGTVSVGVNVQDASGDPVDHAFQFTLFAGGSGLTPTSTEVRAAHTSEGCVDAPDPDAGACTTRG